MTEINLETLGKYRLVDEIGRGRFSIVYRAEHPFLKKTVAIKLMLPALFSQPGVIQGFIQEVRSVATLKHENLTKILDLAEDQNNLYMVMDYFKGGDLTEWQQARGRLSFYQVRRILKDTAAALDFAHSQGITHGDVKPGNILLAEDGSVALADLGVLQAVAASGAASHEVANGTPEYSSPEQKTSSKASPLSDQYSLGVVAYELFTGQVPFDGDTPLAISLKQMREVPSPASQFNPLITAQLDKVLRQVLEIDPGKRFPDCTSFVRAIIQAESSTEAEQYQDLLARANAALQLGDAETALPLIEYAMQIMPTEAAARAMFDQLQEHEQVESSYQDASEALATARAGAHVLMAELESPADPQGVLSQLVPQPPVGWQTWLRRWQLSLYIVLGLMFLGMLLGVAGVTYASVAPSDNLPKATLIALARTSTPVPASQTPSPTLPPTETAPPTTTFTPTAEPTLTMVPTLGAGSVSTRGSDSMVMVYIPAGSFTMGSENRAEEKPVHTVTLDAYWFDRTEVTNEMYERCVRQSACVAKNRTTSFSRSRYYTDPQYADFPVLQVDWNQAKAYCAWAGVRLPTEAEWEKAARGTDGRTYPWGEGIDDTLANYGRSSDDTTLAGSYQNGVSPYGVYDLSGNVWEWVSSQYRPYPYSADDGREELSANVARVLRGGSWYDDALRLQSTYRDKLMPSNLGDKIGFRCAQDANP